MLAVFAVAARLVLLLKARCWHVGRRARFPGVPMAVLWLPAILPWCSFGPLAFLKLCLETPEGQKNEKKTATFLLAAIAIGSSFTIPVYAHGHQENSAPAVYGEPGQSQKAGQTVTIAMSDTMRFSPARVTVRKDETVRFVFKNTGKLTHEWVLGTAQELKGHAAKMKAMPGMAHHDVNAVSVAPGGKARLVWHFTHAGTFPFACLVPGHSEAGMIGDIIVTAR